MLLFLQVELKPKGRSEANEFARILVAAGRNVATEQRDPSNARLDVVEFASDVGAPAAYDVSIVTPLRADADFREACAAEPGLAAECRHNFKLSRQYARRRAGSSLVPLVAEIGGRWHPSVPRLVRRFAKDAASRSVTPSQECATALAARWCARLSALLICGNAAVQRAARCEHPAQPRPWCADAAALPHQLPEGVCMYCTSCFAISSLAATVKPLRLRYEPLCRLVRRREFNSVDISGLSRL